jgi:hypothetical protein
MPTKAIPIDDINYTPFKGSGDVESWIRQACQAAGVPPNQAWMEGYKTLCKRESSDEPDAINRTDINATGRIAQDGYPLNCSRGIAQCVPTTFAAFHADGTSVCIYDPVANIAASMQYVRHHYSVSLDGSDLVARVQQADRKRPPHGYFLPQFRNALDASRPAIPRPVNTRPSYVDREVA